MELTLKHIHTYQKLVDTIGLLPLCCGECDSEVVPGEDDHNKVYLKCYSCDTKFYPGLRIQKIILDTLGSSF